MAIKEISLLSVTRPMFVYIPHSPSHTLTHGSYSISKTFLLSRPKVEGIGLFGMFLRARERERAKGLFINQCGKIKLNVRGKVVLLRGYVFFLSLFLHSSHK